MAAPTIDFDRLFKLRLVVARHGEMDRARWWNTQGVLGRRGGVVLRRGFPSTHRFVQARVVFEVRCAPDWSLAVPSPDPRRGTVAHGRRTTWSVRTALTVWPGLANLHNFRRFSGYLIRSDRLFLREADRRHRRR